MGPLVTNDINGVLGCLNERKVKFQSFGYKG